MNVPGFIFLLLLLLLLLLLTFWYFIVPCGKFESPYLGKTQHLQEQRDLFLSVRAVFSCVHTMAWLPVLGISNVCTDVDACDCTRVAVRAR